MNRLDETSEPGFWFHAKQYGWGWDWPATWQGWLVYLIYFGLQYPGYRHFIAQRDIRGYLIFLAALTVLLVIIVIIKGERPAK